MQNTLKTLQLRKVHLWPRFQVLISDNLAQTSGDVVELRQPMTEAMDKIQQALVECMEATLAEVRRLNPMVKERRKDKTTVVSLRIINEKYR